MAPAKRANPNVYFLHISGDDALAAAATQLQQPYGGKMEYAKMMAGFVAARPPRPAKLATWARSSNQQNCRLAASAYLGAKYAWQTVLKKKPRPAKFQVTWIGFWFNIPGSDFRPDPGGENFSTPAMTCLFRNRDHRGLDVRAEEEKEGKNGLGHPL